MKRAPGRFLRRPLALTLAAVVLLATAGVVWRQWPEHYLQEGEKSLQARQYSKAREQLLRYLTFRPNHPRALLLTARIARRFREYYQAFEYLRRYRGAGGDRETFEVEMALIGVQRGEEPSPELRRRGEENDELALAILEVLIQHDLDTYRLRQALHGLTRYLQRRPEDLQALLSRGYVWERFLYFADALGDYRKAVEHHPDSREARLKLAETLLIAGTPGEALVHYEWLQEHRQVPERLAGKSRSELAVQVGLARCRRRLGQAEEARRLLDAILSQDPGAGEALWERGQLAMDEGKPGAAEAFLRKAVEVRPHDRRIAHSLNRCLLARGKHAEAEKVKSRVAELDADLRRLDQVRQAVMDRPRDASLRCEGGILFLRNGEREEGLRWLRQALRLDPGYEKARQALAETELRENRGRQSEQKPPNLLSEEHLQLDTEKRSD